MSVGGSANKSSQKGSSTSVMTPNVPPEIQWPVFATSSKAGEMLTHDPSSYFAKPGSNSAWNDAMSQTRALGGQSAPQVQSASLLDGLEKYMSPYRDQVVNSFTADFDANAGRTRAAQDLAIAGQGGYAGSGSALLKGQTEGELARARSAGLSQLLDQMFNTGAGFANQDAGRRQDASSQNAQLELANRQQSLGALQSLFDMGTTTQDAENQYRQAPLFQLDALAGILGKLPTDLFQGMTETSASKGSGSSFGLSASWAPQFGGKSIGNK